MKLLYKDRGEQIYVSRKPIYGTCSLCGEHKKLSFEHVPPETTFNTSKVLALTGDALIKSIANENILPWEFEKEKGKIQQRGRGGYYLCADCNSKTGQWYVPEYSKFIHTIHSALMKVGKQEYKSLGIKMQGMRPLPIFKQIMTMFCDINSGLMGDESLREYLLNKTSQEFNKKRYHLYAYIHCGELVRSNGISAMICQDGVIMLTEISMYPVGFALYIDKPESYKPEGVDLTCFSDFKYEDEGVIDMIIPKLENNIIFSGDYRTKEEIMGCIEDSKRNN